MSEEVPEKLKDALDSHPCYCEEAHHKFARMHIPVAPDCNIQCNYCNRKYDCTNESRPGVTSEVLSPQAAVEKIQYVMERIPYLKVIGIAGPGDPLANDATFETLELVKERFPDLTLCLSTNGLNLPKYAVRLKELGVNFITVTINAVDPDVGKDLYQFVRWEGETLRGRAAAERLIGNQLEGVRLCSEMGLLVKVNTVMVPEVNAHHIPEVAKKVKELGAYMVNILPLIPVEDTVFETMRAPTARERRELQDLCENDIKMMRHCKQCRADAIGLLGHDRSKEFKDAPCGSTCGPTQPLSASVSIDPCKFRAAVATAGGEVIDRGFGATDRFMLYDVDGDAMALAGEVDVSGDLDIPLVGREHQEKLERAASALQGVDVVIATEFGERAIQILLSHRIMPIVATGSVDAALRAAKESAT